MKSRNTLLTVTAAIVASFSINLPVSAQSSLEPNQPVVGNLHVVEANLEAQLKHDYNAGLIDPLELANMQRDLDVIKVKEEAFRMRKQGMTDEAEQKIADRLSEFQSRLLSKVADKGHVASATYVEMY